MAHQPRVALAFAIAAVAASIDISTANMVDDANGTHGVPAQVRDSLRLDTVIYRAGVYVTEFERQLSRIIAEESYVQDLRRAPEALKKRGPLKPGVVTHRELQSDLLLIRPDNARRYIEYRDVFSVDGEPIRDRRERLSELLHDATGSQIDRFRRIADESARFNIGDVERNINTPVLPLLFLMPDNQWRFKFKRATDATPANAGNQMRRTDQAAVEGAQRPAERSGGSEAHFRVSTEVWVVEFKEVERHTIIGTPRGADRPVHGRFWIEPESGRVLMSELIAEDRALRATIDVSYQSEPDLKAGGGELLVPVEMRERYDARRDGLVITGSAIYSRFRAGSE